MRANCEADIPVSLLRQLVTYDPTSGTLRWLPRPADLFEGHNPSKSMATWNTRFAGTRALTAKTTNGYLRGTIFGVHLKAHRVAWAVVHGEWPEGTIDHEDGDTANNKLDNLRSVTQGENSKNQKLRSTNTSGTMGVSLDRRRSKWVAEIYDSGRKRYVGQFSNKADAIKARLAVQHKLGYHNNHGRISNA